MAGRNKRIVFNFDGTWNRLDAACPTNVVLTSESVLPVASDGTAQLNYYDQGVGTGRGERIRGGVFGRGLTRNLADAYRNLVFNYTPGDEIFVFGFSRGAFTARSFVGLIRNCGIVRREHAAQTAAAIDLYRSRRPDDAPWGREAEKFRSKYAHPPAKIAYLGVWDTVGALGIPNYYFVSGLVNGKYRFHDHKLSSSVLSARHAVAIDETRRAFEPTPWKNIDELNREVGDDPDAPDARYQQKWFAGVHSAVGGGLPLRGLSDQALEWIWAGARLAGLELDTSPSSRLYSLRPNFRDPLDGVDRSRLGRWARLKGAVAARIWRRGAREDGPATIHRLSVAACRRWRAPSAALPERTVYRPSMLIPIAPHMDADPEYQNPAPVPARGTFQVVIVERGDTLSGIARERLGSADEWPRIFEMNRDKLADPDRIYCGMSLRVPRR